MDSMKKYLIIWFVGIVIGGIGTAMYWLEMKTLGSLFVWCGGIVAMSGIIRGMIKRHSGK